MKYVVLITLAVTGLLYHFRSSSSTSNTSSNNESSTSSNYFRNDYYEARALFRSTIRKFPHAELHSLPMTHLPDYDLTIDIGMIKRSPSKVMIHISGTHGVEGFAGSAIQAAVLNE